VDVSVPCGASVDKRKELAEALRELDANPMRKKTLLLDLKRHFSLSSKIIGIPIQEAFNNVRKELKILQEMHNSASRKPSNAACIAATGVPAAPVDKRKELADALHALDADSRKNKTKLFDVKKKFALSTRIKGVPIQEALTNVRKELKTLQHNSAVGTANNAACVTAMGVPTDAAFTSQVPSAGEVSSTGDPPDTGKARLQTCPEAPLENTLVLHSENPVVARWPVLGSAVLGLAWLAMPGREESTLLLDGANLHGENVALSDECSSAASGDGFTDDGISTPDVMTATMKEPPFERSDFRVAREDSAQVDHKASLLNRCAVALVISGAVIGIWLIWMSRSSITREIPQHAEHSCDANAPLLCSARVVDEVTDHTVMAASHNNTPAISMLRGVDGVAGCQAQGGERHAVVVPLVDGWKSEPPEGHAVSLPCDQETLDDTGPAVARVVFENFPQTPQQWDMSASVRGISGRVRSRVRCFEK